MQHGRKRIKNAICNTSLIVAIHHPPFTGSSQHVPSPAMLADIDNACAQAGILPDLVLSGHAHLYERYTRSMQGRQIPFLVAGTGGYFNLSKFKTGTGGAVVNPTHHRDRRQRQSPHARSDGRC